jgi:hypothetical protein
MIKNLSVISFPRKAALLLTLALTLALAGSTEAWGGVVNVSNWAGLQTALETDGNEITLLNNITDGTGDKTLTINGNNITINGGGYTIEGRLVITSNTDIEVIINNLNFEDDTNHDSLPNRAILNINPAADITITVTLNNSALKHVPDASTAYTYIEGILLVRAIDGNGAVDLTLNNTEITLNKTNTQTGVPTLGSQAITVKVKNSTIDILNGSTISAAGEAKSFGLIVQGDNNEITIEDSTVSAEKFHAVSLVNDGTEGNTLTITGSTLRGWSAIRVGVSAESAPGPQGNGSIITVSDSTLEGTAPHSGNSDSYGIVVVEEETDPPCEVTITGSKIIGENTGDGIVYSALLIKNSKTELIAAENTIEMKDEGEGSLILGVIRNTSEIEDALANTQINGNYWDIDSEHDRVTRSVIGVADDDNDVADLILTSPLSENLGAYTYYEADPSENPDAEIALVISDDSIDGDSITLAAGDVRVSVSYGIVH